MAESVKVIVRCRPMNARETGLKCNGVLKIITDIAQCTINNPNEKGAPPKSFTFDGAYAEESTTEQIYTDIGYPLVEGVTEGYNGTIFAYGQTGSGKSFSMQGLTQPECQRGIIPRAFEHIFETIQVTEGSKFLVHASYVEIYNEEVRDLLGKDIKRKLDLKEHPEKGVYIQDLSKHMCKNVSDCGKVMETGWKNRSTGSTLMNADSSRSHSIFTIHLERCETDKKGENRIRGAKLNLVDLAGSERQSKTGATGDRLKEATKINLSLSALGNVISALVDGKSTHIPYRDSKLTRLLQDSLGGNTKTLMVACLSPADNNYDETLSTLRYANRAKNIRNKPKINEDPKDAMIREYQEEIKRLKAMLSGELTLQLDDTKNGFTKNTKVKNNSKIDIEAERNRLKKEYEHELKTMREELRTMKLSKDEVESEMTRLREHYENRLQTLENDKIKVDSDGTKSSALQRSQEKSYKDIQDNESLEDPNDEHDEKISVNGNINVNNKLVNNAVMARTKNQNKKSKNGLPDQILQNLELDEQITEEQQSQNLTLGDQEKNKGGGTSLDIKKQKDQLGRTEGTHELDPTEAEKRMRELEQNYQLVGGEQVGNKELVEKRKRRMKYAEERHKKLREAMALEGEDILVNIYENINQELKGTRSKFRAEQNRAASLESEIKDLQSEFESYRRDYLSTIREQEKELKYLQAIIARIHPTLRRDCNYSSLMRIRNQATWDEENSQWNLPEMTLEKTKLPTPGTSTVNGSLGAASYYDDGVTFSPEELDSEDRLQQKLRSCDNADASATFVSNRARQLMQNASDVRGAARNVLVSHSSSASALYANNYDNNSSPMWSHEGSSASLNEMDEPEPVRRPIRLQSLKPITSVKQNKKNNRKPSIL